MGSDGAKVENRVSVHIFDGQTLEEKSEDAIVANVVDKLLQSLSPPGRAESNSDPHPHAGYPANHQQPIRSAIMGLYGFDEAAIEDETPTRVDAEEDESVPVR